jgi:twitching motility protein PilT
MDITELLTAAVQAEASDLHLKSGNYPMMRVHGELRPIVDDRRLEPATMDAMAAALLPAALQSRLAREHEVDFAYSIAGLGRFRCNVFHQRGTVAMALRVIPMRVSSIDDLELPPILKTIADGERGLVLLTGTTGSGKSTTLAALIDHINHTRAAHIMTVEDPIEYLHRDHMSIINQREVNIDTQGFAQALRSSLRRIRTSSWSARCATSKRSRPG